MSRLNEVATGLVQGGEVTFDFVPGPPADHIWTGSFIVGPNVNADALFQVTVGIQGSGTPWGAWNGPSPPQGGVVQAVRQETIEVVGFGIMLPGNTQLTCQLIGSDELEGQVPYLWPAGGPFKGTVKPPGQTTYGDLDAAYATYGDLDKAFSTYGAMDRFRAVTP